MIENIALIASIISALTAVTTSLRAVGKAREYSRDRLASGTSSGSRLGGLKAGPAGVPKGGSLLIHLISTLIWFVLSAAFAAPMLFHIWKSNGNIRLLVWTAPFLILIILLILIWRKVLRHS